MLFEWIFSAIFLQKYDAGKALRFYYDSYSEMLLLSKTLNPANTDKDLKKWIAMEPGQVWVKLDIITIFIIFL